MPRPASEDAKREWTNLIEQQRKSGLSIEKWCLQHQIRPHTFHYWKEKLLAKSLQTTSFTELNVKRPDAITLQACGIHIRIGGDCNPNLRKQIFALFSEGSC